MAFAFQRYLAELVLAQQPLPRRQEAESLKFTSGGITQTALVTHEEVQEWATGSRKAIMCSISHAWETREHPDPCRQGTGLLRIFFLRNNLEHKLGIISDCGFHEWMVILSLASLVAFFFHVLPRGFVKRVFIGFYRNEKRSGSLSPLRIPLENGWRRLKTKAL